MNRDRMALAFLRFYLGFVWFSSGLSHLLDRKWVGPKGDCESDIVSFSAGLHGPYQDFLHAVVLPNITVFSILVEWGETLAGISLMIGLLTRLGAAGSIFLALNYWLGRSAWRSWLEYISLEAILSVMALLVILLPTDAFSVDAVLAKTLRRRRKTRRG